MIPVSAVRLVDYVVIGISGAELLPHSNFARSSPHYWHTSRLAGSYLKQGSFGA